MYCDGAGRAYGDVPFYWSTLEHPPTKATLEQLAELSKTPSSRPFLFNDPDRNRVIDICRKSGVGLVSLPPRPATPPPSG